MAVCCIKCVDLTPETMNFFFSQSKIINRKQNCWKTLNIQNILKLWRMRNITLEGKILIFKILALSKIVSLIFAASFSKQ